MPRAHSEVAPPASKLIDLSLLQMRRKQFYADLEVNRLIRGARNETGARKFVGHRKYFIIWRGCRRPTEHTQK